MFPSTSIIPSTPHVEKLFLLQSTEQKALEVVMENFSQGSSLSAEGNTVYNSGGIHQQGSGKLEFIESYNTWIERVTILLTAMSDYQSSNECHIIESSSSPLTPLAGGRSICDNMEVHRQGSAKYEIIETLDSPPVSPVKRSLLLGSYHGSSTKSPQSPLFRSGLLLNPRFTSVTPPVSISSLPNSESSTNGNATIWESFRS